MPADLACPTVHSQTSRQPEVLADIAQKGINICIWNRPRRPEWNHAITKILTHPNKLHLDLTAPSANEIAAFIQSQTVPDPETSASVESLAADIFDLSRRFAALAEIKHPRVRLTRIEDEGCALFHADTLVLRMLCTYAGPGTQWLENNNVRRDELGCRGRTLAEATAAIVVHSEKIRTLPEAHVAIVKGRLYEEEKHNALVHRSAPLRHPADYRLRLCIDYPNNCAC